jgi:HAMP domain-containing protein
MPIENCPERDAISNSIQEVLNAMARLSHKLADAVSSGDPNEKTLDDEIERLMAEKERLLGALHQHRREHKC